MLVFSPKKIATRSKMNRIGWRRCGSNMSDLVMLCKEFISGNENSEHCATSIGTKKKLCL